MMQYLAYIPYAAVGYCVAKAATDVWPTLRSQLGALSHQSSRHGLDGEDYGPRHAMSYCPPGGGMSLATGFTAGAHRNQSSVPLGPQTAFVAETAVPAYCFDEASGTIVGSGPLDGVVPPETATSIWVENGQRLATINVGGDNEMTIPTCVQAQTMGFTSVPGEPPPPPGGRTPPERRRPPGRGTPPDGCDPRFGSPRSGSPLWRQAEPCGPERPWRRGSDGGRLARKRNRWG